MRPTRLKPYRLEAGQTIMELAMPGTLPISMDDLVDLRAFLQAVVRRAGVGNLRYGEAATRKQYLTRMKKELRAYTKTGNGEHLFNVAAYAWLETLRPQHRAFHLNALAESVTRKEMGGNLA